MKKYILVLISLFVLTSVSMNVVNADYCRSEVNPKTCVDYVFDTGHGEKLVSIYVPENIEYLEYLAMTGQLNTNSYAYKLIYLNTLLIKRGYDSIY